MSASTAEPHLAIAAERDLLPGAGGEFWTRRAPQSVAQGYRELEDLAGWRAWRKHLARRRKPLQPAALFPGRESALLWAMPAESNLAATAELIERLTSRRGGKAETQTRLTAEVDNWLWSCETPGRSGQWALESVAWAHALPGLAEHLKAAHWWRLLDRLIALVQLGDRSDLLGDPLVNQLVAGELPLTLAYQLPELDACRQLRLAASATLARGVTEILDGEGLPQASYLGIWRPLVACWTRSRAIGGKATWDPECETQYRLLIQEFIRLSRGDGSQIFVHDESGKWTPKLCKLALKLVDKSALDRLAARVLPSVKSTDGAGQPSRRSAVHSDVEPGVHSEWAEIAVLHPHWRRGGPKLSVAYDDRRTRLELELRGELIFSGSWDLEVRLGGEPAELTTAWEANCWLSDKDIDYLEIEARLAGGAKVQRQILIAREERCLFFGDAVLGVQCGEIEYSARLPIAPTIRIEPAAETREVSLAGKKAAVSVLPLALSEWRSDPRRGELSPENGGLRLRQSVHGQHLYAPLLLDFDRKRSAVGLTWRQLTIAEQRRVQPADVAVGYRAQTGKAQWLAYRSLAAVANRTVLGQNLSTEFMFGKFHRTGEVDRLIEIE
jgi:hypothetical protein